MSVDDNQDEEEEDSFTEDDEKNNEELKIDLQKQEDDGNRVLVDDEGERVYDWKALEPGYQLSSLRPHLDYFHMVEMNGKSLHHSSTMQPVKRGSVFD